VNYDFAKLCIFLTSGKTFTFLDVTVITDNEYALTFVYSAMSDGLTKRATFYKSQVAGVSTTQYPDITAPAEEVAS
jgi:hypothetical protein